MSTLFLRFSARVPAAPRRERLLERLLARADGCSRVVDWRAHAFAGLAPGAAMPGLGAVALRAAAVGVDGAWVYLATPVRHSAGMSSLSLQAGAVLSLQGPEAEALARDFNRLFGGGGTRLVAAAAQLYCVFDAPVPADTHDPQEAMERDLWGYLPGGPAGAHLRGLMSEMEMWLHDHPVNAARTARGAAAITGLWLWGGGPLLPALPVLEGWTAGADVFFGAFAATPATPVAGPGSGVVVLDASPGTPQWQEGATRWLAPAVVELHSHRIERLELSAGDRLFELGARSRWRLWRHRRPWWEQLA